MDYQAIDSFMKKNGLDKDPAFEYLHFLNESIPATTQKTILGLYFPEGSEPHHQYGYLPPSTIILPEDADASTLLHELGHRHGHYYHNDISEPYAEEYRKLHEGQIKMEPVMRVKEDMVCDYCPDSKNGRQNCPWCEYGKTAIPHVEKHWVKKGRVAARKSESRYAAATIVQLEYPYNSGVGTPQITFPPGAKVGVLIKGGGVEQNFTVSMYPDGDPGNILFTQQHSTDWAGNANIPVTLPNQQLDLTIAVTFSPFVFGWITYPGFTETLQFSTVPVTGPGIICWFEVNGYQGVPSIPPGGTVNAVMYVSNMDSAAHNLNVFCSEEYTGTLIYNGNTAVKIAAGQTLSFNLNSFTMPNANDGILYSIYVDGNPVKAGDEAIPLGSTTGPATSVTDIVMTGSIAEGQTVSYTAVITNISGETIQVIANAAGPSNTSITVNGVTSASGETAPFSLAPGQQQQVSGSFVMPGVATGVLTVSTYVNGNINLVDSEEQATITLTESPQLTISNSNNIPVSSPDLTISVTGFLPVSDLSINVIDSAGTVTYIGSIPTDDNGAYSGIIPAVAESQITPGGTTVTGGATKAGNYTLRLSDVNNYTASAPFTVVAPMPTWEKILIGVAIGAGVVGSVYVVSKVSDFTKKFR